MLSGRITLLLPPVCPVQMHVYIYKGTYGVVVSCIIMSEIWADSLLVAVCNAVVAPLLLALLQ